jgi:hypothetical protein
MMGLFLAACGCTSRDTLGSDNNSTVQVQQSSTPGENEQKESKAESDKVTTPEKNSPLSTETESEDDMDQEDQEAEDFGTKLEKAGHTCVEYLESYPVQISWCQQTPCTHREKATQLNRSETDTETDTETDSETDSEESEDDTETRSSMAERNDMEMEFGDKLIKEGHTCVRHLESYPVQISWCRGTPCKNNK